MRGVLPFAPTARLVSETGVVEIGAQREALFGKPAPELSRNSTSAESLAARADSPCSKRREPPKDQ